MGILAAVLGALAAVLAVACCGMSSELERRETKIREIRRQLDRYLHDDQRMLDALWNRAQLEADRATRASQRR